MKRNLPIALAVAVVVTMTAVAAKENKDPLAEAKCPISGQKVSKDAAVDYKGGKIYFCCSGCPSAFEKDRAKYETKANQQLVVTGQAKQIACPITGTKFAEDTKIDVDGAEVAFCCTGCQGAVKKADEAKQREMVFGKNFDKAFKIEKEQKEAKATP